MSHSVCNSSNLGSTGVENPSQSRIDSQSHHDDFKSDSRTHTLHDKKPQSHLKQRHTSSNFTNTSNEGFSSESDRERDSESESDKEREREKEKMLLHKFAEAQKHTVPGECHHHPSILDHSLKGTTTLATVLHHQYFKMDPGASYKDLWRDFNDELVRQGWAGGEIPYDTVVKFCEHSLLMKDRQRE